MATKLSSLGKRALRSPRTMGAGVASALLLMMLVALSAPVSACGSWNSSLYAQSPAQSFTMVTGTTQAAWVQFYNNSTNSAAWDSLTRLGAWQYSNPPDRSSAFYTPGDWIGPNRPTAMDTSSVAAGAVGKFSFTMTAPAPGYYDAEYFQMLDEGNCWFGALVRWIITVIPPTPAFSGATSVCASSTGNTATITNVYSGATKAWTISGGTITAGSTGTTVTYTAGTGSTVTLHATQTVNGQTSSSGTKNVTVDTAPPGAPNLTGIPTYTNGTSVSAYFSGSSGCLSYYQGQVDSGGYSTWGTSPRSIDISALGQGSHTVYVRGVNYTGTGGTADTATFIKDTIAPTVVVSDNHADAIVRDADTVVITATFSDTNGINETSPPAITIANGGVSSAAMSKTSNLVWTYSWNVPTGNAAATVSVSASDVAGNANSAATGKTSYTIDNTAPTVTSVTVTPENVGSTGDCLKGKLWVRADAEDSLGIDAVEVMLTDGSWATMSLKSGTTKTYEKEFAINASSVNGARTASVRATDLAGNTTASAVTQNYTVNKNEISGLIALQGFTGTSRVTTFVINGDSAKSVAIAAPFIAGSGSYRFTDVPEEITSISAKTPWSLRKRLTFSAAQDGQYLLKDFTGSYEVRGGDLNDDNVVNALDYSILRGAWGSGSVGDINGDGLTNNSDYLTMKSNWYGKGDAE